MKRKKEMTDEEILESLTLQMIAHFMMTDPKAVMEMLTRESKLLRRRRRKVCRGDHFAM
jgi:hypothetical protein